MEPTIDAVSRAICAQASVRLERNLQDLRLYIRSALQTYTKRGIMSTTLIRDDPEYREILLAIANQTAVPTVTETRYQDILLEELVKSPKLP